MRVRSGAEHARPRLAEACVLSEKERWEREAIKPALRLQPERRPEFRTGSGIPIQRLYTPGDLAPDHDAALGYPGEFPFTRGVYPTMYRARLWTM
ncbi:MAG: hypothetical protein HY703_04420, partial [Gemmatimonadetes bacterium]|nr:hypothetical protein [Gemmatimonadota bacterium]